MFDLVDILKKSDSQHSEAQKEITSVLFYQTEKCQSLVKEAYRFEGLVPPALLINSDEQIKEHVRNEHIEIVIIELNESRDISRDAERISHLLPNDASVIVIGCEDAISTIRNLKQMGFYYLFWPITKHELIEFVISVHDNRHSHKGLGKKRKAKQISVLGCKGGVGTTFLCSEIGYLLAEKKNSSCVVVDNDYHGGNLDIMLGMEKFEKRLIRAGSFSTTLDPTSAQSMLNKHTKLLSVLSLTPTAGMGNADVKEYTKTVASQVAENVNFIVEDLSAIAQQGFDHKELVELSDCLILVFSPTVSALREAARIKQRMMEDKENVPCRMYMVMNCVVPDSAATVSLEEAEKYLHQPVDIVIPYIKKLDAMILDNKRISQSGGKPEKALYRLVSLIVGEETKKGLRLPFMHR
ncbi:type II secretion system protein Z [Vibrio sp. HA2012]|uniref:AAA family ATPase n=1 Tax=Vibrio sp. HA2012 TaxID=1971595 RepID=UPI000C2B81B3|nr:type II secretion system protein Z [Vibrio sp. HA2012]PJC86110.1 type II secretion system protein Z [Vibrio sp. HA2012]